MSYVAIAGTVISVAGSAYAANQSKKAAAKAGGSLDEAIAYARVHPEAFGSKPDSWDQLDYAPLFQTDPGYANMAASVVAGNQRNLPGTIGLSRDVNAYATEDAKTRMGAWDPTFQDSFAQQQQNTSNLLAGRLPFEDLQGITSRRSELNSILGGAGNGQQTAADLGLSRIGLMQQGQAALNSNADLISRVDPFARRVTPQSMFVDTNQAINNAIGENWNDYQAAAKERDAAFAYEALADPYQQGLLNLLAGQSGFQGGTNSIAQGMNWAQTGQQVSSAMNAWNNRNNAPATAGGAYGAGQTAWGTSAPESYNGTIRTLGDTSGSPV